MGSQAFQFLLQFPIPVTHSRPRGFAYDSYTTGKGRRFSGGGWRRRRLWDRNANPDRRSRFSDAYGYDEEDGHGYRSGKRRMWWSDEIGDEEDEEDEGFGVLEGSIGFNWVFKVFRAFGWMIPAVIISFLVGTGPNAIIMAVALPLAQSALSLAAETLWGTSYETPKPKSKRKKRPFASTTGRTRVKRENETWFQAKREAGDYKSWVDANNVTDKNGKSSRQNFGGWDELDKEPQATPNKHADEKRAQERGKISRRTKGDTPLLMRLLIAMFPYLGFWTKLF